MRADPHPDWRGYLAILCGGSATAIAALLTLNYVVDPYLIHQWDTPAVMRLRPPREKMSAWGKTYAVARYKPSVLYLGNSRTELGMPTRLPLFVGQDVFNGALSGASLGDTLAMAQHAFAVGRPATVIWGIDAPSFSMEVGNTDFDRALVAHDNLYRWRRRLLDLKRALTVDMTRDSLSVLMGTFGAVCHSSLAFHGQRDALCMRNSAVGAWNGTRAAVVPRTREFVRGAGPTPAAASALAGMVDTMCRAGTRVRLYINPTHAMMEDALYWAGKWQALEHWQASLATMAELQRGRGCDVRVYDFSGFNSVTTEAIPQATRREWMANYWEPSHYRVNVGQMVLNRLFNDGDNAIPGDFGVELTPAAMPAHLAAARAGRERYHVQHELETAMARDIATEQLALAHAGRP